MRLSNWDIEERVTAVVARLAGVSACHIGPDLRLRYLGCDSAKVIDLVQVLEDEFETSDDVEIDHRLETVWDVVRLFHRAVHGEAPRQAVRVGGFVIEF